VFIVFICLDLLSYIKFCIFVFCLLVRWPSDWLGILTLVISFMSKGFPKKGQIEELFIVVLFHMCQTRNIVNFFINSLF